MEALIKNMKTSVKIAGVAAKIRIQHLLNTNLERPAKPTRSVSNDPVMRAQEMNAKDDTVTINEISFLISRYRVNVL
jgi:hypothetical protein